MKDDITAALAQLKEAGFGQDPPSAAMTHAERVALSAPVHSTPTATPWPLDWWHPGMRVLPDGDRPALQVYHVRAPEPHAGIPDDHRLLFCVDVSDKIGEARNVHPSHAHPDLEDGPTKGALLDMVRERHPGAQVSPLVHLRTGKVYGWTWYLNDTANPGGETKGGDYATEGEAYKAALDHLAKGVS